ncbi:MAG TPA: hypothetical protein PLN53_05005 [Terricaulis sp.]|nr:hypothetical protein [Terricaulis sp.]
MPATRNIAAPSVDAGFCAEFHEARWPHSDAAPLSHAFSRDLDRFWRGAGRAADILGAHGNLIQRDRNPGWHRKHAKLNGHMQHAIWQRLKLRQRRRRELKTFRNAQGGPA